RVAPDDETLGDGCARFPRGFTLEAGAFEGRNGGRFVESAEPGDRDSDGRTARLRARLLRNRRGECGATEPRRDDEDDRATSLNLRRKGRLGPDDLPLGNRLAGLGPGIRHESGPPQLREGRHLVLYTEVWVHAYSS